MKCMTIVYPWKDGATFDFDYYRKNHMPLVAEALGDKFERLEIRKGIVAVDGSAPPYVCAANVWLRGSLSSKEDLLGILGERGPEVAGDVPNFTNLMPIIQFDDIVASQSS